MASQIPPGLQEAIEKTADKKSSGPRKDSIYTKEERLILDKHKIDYVAKMTRDERESYFRTRILVNIFKHWYDTGEVDESISDDDLAERIKVIEQYPIL